MRFKDFVNEIGVEFENDEEQKILQLLFSGGHSAKLATPVCKSQLKIDIEDFKALILSRYERYFVPWEDSPAILVGHSTQSTKPTWVGLENFSDKDDFDDFLEKYFALVDLLYPIGIKRAPTESIFYDWSGLPNEIISMHHISNDVFEYVGIISDLCDDRKSAFDDFCDYFGHKYNYEAYDKFEGAYITTYAGYSPRIDFAKDEVDLLEMPESIRPYFDTESYAKDLFMDDYTEVNGSIFYRA